MDSAASCTSFPVMLKMALSMMRLAVSPIPMGRTPGFLSEAIRWLAICGAVLAGSTNSVQRRFATKAKEWQSSKDGDLKEVHNLLHPSASRPEGPAAPWVCSAVGMIKTASRDSNRTGCKSGGLQGEQVDREDVYWPRYLSLFLDHYQFQCSHPA